MGPTAMMAGALLTVLTWMGPPAAVTAQSGTFADVCLEVVSEGLSDADWALVVEEVSSVVASRPALFPRAQVSASPAVIEGAGIASLATPSARLDIHSGHAGASIVGASTACLAPDQEWTARFGREFLEASAEQMLADAPTTPGIDSDVVLEWHPDEARVRTLLTFAGPLDIPNGRCWVDDVLSVDASAGIATASAQHGLETSPFAEGACGRFFDHLPDGGAGQQAVTLLPFEIDLDAGRILRFVATEVVVEENAVLLAGTLELR